jgi:hypothetical protein
MASTRETVKAAIKAQFLAMAAAGIYTYPPDVVECVTLDDEAYLDESKTTIYLVRPGGKERVELKDTGTSESKWPITVIAATKYTATPQEFPAGETSQQRLEKEIDLVADIVQCISRDPRFGGVAVGALNAGFDIDYGYMAEWAVVQVAFTVEYRFATGGR